MTEEFDFEHYEKGFKRGPYGTNKGDMWLAPGSSIQERLDREGEGLVLVHEMVERDGKIQEGIYVTDNAELIEEARRGHELYVAEQASQN
jgi:hypothetical protein